ncbi:MAG: hypothetical protein ABGX16_25250 [Pirellulales bacterium]
MLQRLGHCTNGTQLIYYLDRIDRSHIPIWVTIYILWESLIVILSDAFLSEHKCNLPMSREVSNWLADLGDSLYRLLADRGYIEPRAEAIKLRSFIDSYIESSTDVTERRLGKFRVTRGRIIEFFGNVELSSITAGAADEYSR